MTTKTNLPRCETCGYLVFRQEKSVILPGEDWPDMVVVHLGCLPEGLEVPYLQWTPPEESEEDEDD